MYYSDQSRISSNSDTDTEGDIIRVEDYNESSDDQNLSITSQKSDKKSFMIENILGINRNDNNSSKSDEDSIVGDSSKIGKDLVRVKSGINLMINRGVLLHFYST